MIDDDKWNPINDVWEEYSSRLESFREMIPYIELEPEEMQNVLWPEDLYLGETEVKNAQEFVANRTIEILQLVKRYNGLHPDMLYSYIMKSLISGMLWEKERIG